MNAHIVKLTFDAPVHFGSGRLSDAEYACSADTVFSALFIESLAHGSSEQLLGAVKSGELLISDTFPWIGKDYYLPKPRIVVKRDSNRKQEEIDSVAKKAFKQLDYVSWGQFEAFLDGSIDAVKARDALHHGLGLSGLTTKVKLAQEDADELSEAELAVRDATAPPSAQRRLDPEPYHVGGFSFCDNAGLYFLVKGDMTLLLPLLESLQYSGIGGKRSSGYGRFTYEVVEKPNLAFPSLEGSFAILLSTAAPTEEELTDELLKDALYSLKKRSGFVQTSSSSQGFTKKRDFFSFGAGSTFAQKFDGDVFDVAQSCDHPVWRYAKAFWMEG